MTSLLFVLWLHFPPGPCACIQVPALADLTPFEHVAVELYATEPSQVPNEGVYTVRNVLYWPSGIAVIIVSPKPPVTDSLAAYTYGVVPIGPKRLIFADGFEDGVANWSLVISEE